MFTALRSLAVVAALLCMAACRSPVGAFVRENGYNEYRPPSTLLPPGTIVFVKQAAPLTLGVICTASGSLGAVVPSDSGSADISKKMTKKGEFKLDADYVEQIKGQLGVNYVKDVQLEFANVKVLNIPDELVYANVKNRSDGCRKAIAAAQLLPNRQPTMISEVIQADVTYQVIFTSGADVSVSAKLEAVKGLAAALGAKIESATTESVKGDGLFWGLRDDKYLASIAGPLVPESGAKRVPERLVPLGVLRVDSADPMDRN